MHDEDHDEDAESLISARQVIFGQLIRKLKIPEADRLRLFASTGGDAGRWLSNLDHVSVAELAGLEQYVICNLSRLAEPDGASNGPLPMLVGESEIRTSDQGVPVAERASDSVQHYHRYCSANLQIACLAVGMILMRERPGSLVYEFAARIASTLDAAQSDLDLMGEALEAKKDRGN